MSIPEKVSLIDDENAWAREDKADKEITVSQKKKMEDWYRHQARQRHEQEGTIEVDPDAPVSLGGDPGAYVQAWVWVDNPMCVSCGTMIDDLEVWKGGEFRCEKCRRIVDDVVDAIEKEVKDESSDND